MAKDSRVRRLRVLLLEDDDTQARSYRDLLRLWGYDVILVSDVETANNVAEHQYLHIAVLDKSLVLGDKTDEHGLEVARRIRKAYKRGSRTPIIVLTAHMPTPNEVAWSVSQAGGGLFDYIDKKEVLDNDPNGRPRLWSALRAATQSLGLNRKLTVKFGPTVPADAMDDPVGWLASAVLEGLGEEADSADQEHLHDQIIDLLGRLFSQGSYTRLELGQMPAGLSGAVVLTCVPWRVPGGAVRMNEIHDATCILKIGGRSKIVRERDATNQWQDLVQGHRVARLIDDADTRDLAVLRLQFIGENLAVPQSLEAFYVQETAERVDRLVEDLFTHVLQLMHQQVSTPEASDLAQAYGLRGSVRDSLSGAFEALFPLDHGQHIIQPAAMPGETYRTFVYDLDAIDFPPDFSWRVACHGDLHGGNVLVYDDKCWLIDLAHAKLAYFLTDFVNLEAWVQYKAVGSVSLNHARRLVQYAASIDPNEPNLLEGLSTLQDSQLEKGIRTVLAIRNAAMRVAQRTWPQLRSQYYAALFYATLAALRFCDTKRPDVALHLLWAAGHCFEQAGGKLRR